MSYIILAALLLPLGDAPLPVAVPTGMDLLYSDRIPFAPSGEPLVTVGLMTGQDRIVVRSRSGLRLDFYDGGTLKQAVVAPQQTVEVSIARARPAELDFLVDVETVAWGDTQGLSATLAGWKARGYATAQAIEEGTALGIGGRLVDTREYHIVVPAANAKAADTLVSEVYDRFGSQALVRTVLRKRPWARLIVTSAGHGLGGATSFVRFASAGAEPVEVLDVEHGVGYAWHGRESRSYHGEIYAAVDPDGKLAAVNVLGAETILEGVVPAEIFASAPPEALKAQAVAARNQLLAKLGTRHHTEPFHLCASQHCQVYAGLSREDPRTTAAVRDTAGEVLFAGPRLVDTVYSSSCGGFSGSNDAVWGGPPDPALRARPDFDVAAHPELRPFVGGIDTSNITDWLAAYPATYCSEASKARRDKFRWRRTFDAAALARIVGRSHPEIGELRDLAAQERGPGGRAIGLRLIGTKGEVTIVHELPIRRLFDNLESGMFVLERKRDAKGRLERVTFVGGGWGHGVGMCQMGAIGRAEAGQSYGAILTAYYAGARIERLYGGPAKP